MRKLADLIPPAGQSSSAQGAEQVQSQTGPTAEPESRVCPYCKGIGYLIKDVPVGHPDFGRLFPCQCKLKDLGIKQSQRLRSMSNLDHLEHMTFASFVPTGNALAPEKQENLRRAYNHAHHFAENSQGWLLFRGGYGCGKTHLAAAIANERLRRGEPALFVVVPDLLDYLRGAYSPTSAVGYDQRFEEIRSHPLLILDDLGTQSSTPWAEEKMFQIFNYRYNARLPTVITTNCELEEIDERIRSRLNSIDLVHVVPILAPDYRASGVHDNQSRLSSLSLHLEKVFHTFDLQRAGLDAVQRQNLHDVVHATQSFAQNPHGWLVLTGTYGCGKTHLAAAIGNFRESQRLSVIFIVVPDLLDHLRATFSPQSTVSYDKLFEQIRRAQLLILDDLGTESATAWAKEKLYQIFNYRYNAQLPTVITTAQKVSAIDPRIRARILDLSLCQVWEILAPPYRGQLAPSKSRRNGSRYR